MKEVKKRKGWRKEVLLKERIKKGKKEGIRTRGRGWKGGRKESREDELE